MKTLVISKAWLLLILLIFKRDQAFFFFYIAIHRWQVHLGFQFPLTNKYSLYKTFNSSLKFQVGKNHSRVAIDSLSLGLYATDASMYQLQPLGVVVPLDREDTLGVIKRCAELGLPLLARGGGTSLTGQSIGEAVILDLSRNLNRILELNLEEAWVRVEPGVVCKELNAFLKQHGVCFAPDPATENRANIGGMIANNAAGMRSILYGMTIDHVLEIDFALSTGDVLHLSQLDSRQLADKLSLSNSEGHIYRGIHSLIEQHADEIRQRFPKVIRRSGGYALDALVDAHSLNLAKLVCGSEGTLGVILEAKLRLTPLPRYSAVCLAHFDSIDASLRATAHIVKERPSAVELIDGIILHQAQEHPLTRDICVMIQENPAAVQIIEVQGDTLDEVAAHIQKLADSLDGYAYAVPVMTEQNDIQSVWKLRSSALGLMTTVKGPRKPVPYIEDAAVPLEALADYVADVLDVCSRYEQPVSLFGHSSVGLMHIRPMHDLHSLADISFMKQIQEEIFLLVRKYGGSWSGEHGDGIVRGGFNQRFFGDELYDAFREVKRLFDPENRMNPGKVIETQSVESHLRFGSDYKPLAVTTLFHFRDQGGLLAAAEQCTGVGECRKTLSGVMCPSFIATRDELHSTRGRANVLRLVLTGQLGRHALASDELREVMDLCLSCKGCKGECPNSVDMARLKAEVLYHFQILHGVSLRSRVFGNIALLASLASGSHSWMVNALLGSTSVRFLMENFLRIDRTRQLPFYTNQRLSHWFAQRLAPEQRGEVGNMRRVLLFNDTYTEHHQPQVGRAAIEVLETAGYRVELVTLGDSQRSAISQGLLDKAKLHGTRLVIQLDLLLSDNVPVLFCESSCATALVNDLPDLLDDFKLAGRVADRVQMLDHFLEQELASGRCVLPWKTSCAFTSRKYLVHSHCHQKTLDGGRWTHRLLSRLPGAVVEDSEAGCCGMAGSFGYEVEHAELSRKIAGQRLLPRLAKEDDDAQVVANGFSCRQQIVDLTNRKPLHVAEVLRDSL